nr:hypothetical protein CFP56_21080 [Quercus suber]
MAVSGRNAEEMRTLDGPSLPEHRLHHIIKRASWRLGDDRSQLDCAFVSDAPGHPGRETRVRGVVMARAEGMGGLFLVERKNGVPRLAITGTLVTRPARGGRVPRSSLDLLVGEGLRVQLEHERGVTVASAAHVWRGVCTDDGLPEKAVRHIRDHDADNDGRVMPARKAESVEACRNGTGHRV